MLRLICENNYHQDVTLPQNLIKNGIPKMGEYLIGGHFVSVVHQNTCFDAFSLNLIVTQQYQYHLSYSKKLFTQYDI